MANENTPDRGRIDLNLFIPLKALLIERNVTKAAERLFITQPSMSSALAKLRRVLDDPLLVRDGRDFVLTPFAETLRQPVQQMLFSARDMLMSNQHFDPALHKRTFTVMASNYVATVLLAPLVPRLLAEAPGAQLRMEPARTDHIDFIRSGRCDLVFWPEHEPAPDLRTFPSTHLFADDFLVAASKDTHFGLPLSADDLRTLPGIQYAATTGWNSSSGPDGPHERNLIRTSSRAPTKTVCRRRCTRPAIPTATWCCAEDRRAPTTTPAAWPRHSPNSPPQTASLD